jgi:hypothetical protein
LATITKIHWRAAFQISNNFDDEGADSLDEFDQEQEEDRVINKV